MDATSEGSARRAAIPAPDSHASVDTTVSCQGLSSRASPMKVRERIQRTSRRAEGHKLWGFFSAACAKS
eukprot:7983684-Pyramimonas_sp.AAC.1